MMGKGGKKTRFRTKTRRGGGQGVRTEVELSKGVDIGLSDGRGSWGGVTWGKRE